MEMKKNETFQLPPRKTKKQYNQLFFYVFNYLLFHLLFIEQFDSLYFLFISKYATLANVFVGSLRFL